jgi:hypothetical protein
MGTFERYFTIIGIKVKEVYGVIDIKLICKKRRFVNTQVFYRFAKNLAEKMIDDNRGEGNYSAGWASPDCKYAELNVHLPLVNGHERLEGAKI